LVQAEAFWPVAVCDASCQEDVQTLKRSSDVISLTTRHNLADFYQRVGRVSEALAIYEPLLADKERILGAQHPRTLAVRHSLADARAGRAS
jgi:hypothetical protein